MRRGRSRSSRPLRVTTSFRERTRDHTQWTPWHRSCTHRSLMSTSLRHLWVICISLLVVGCSRDYYLDGSSPIGVGTQQNTSGTNSNSTSQVSYVYARQVTPIAMTPTAAGNWMRFDRIDADTRQEMSNGIFTPKRPGIFSVNFR